MLLYTQGLVLRFHQDFMRGNVWPDKLFSWLFSMSASSYIVHYRPYGRCFGSLQMQILLFGDYGCISITQRFYVSPALFPKRKSELPNTKASTKVLVLNASLAGGAEKY
jgi:hypothetical protein